MKNKNFVSILFALLFVVNCFVFFSASATQEPSSTPLATTSTTSVTDIQPEPSGDDATQVSSTVPTASVKTSTTTTTTATKTQTTTASSTTTATAVDPVYTTTTTTTTTTRVTYQYDDKGYAITDAYTTTTLADEETVTEPTTMAKIVKDYGSQYDWVKWVSLFGMIISIAGLVVVNVMYKTK